MLVHFEGQIPEDSHCFAIQLTEDCIFVLDRTGSPVNRSEEPRGLKWSSSSLLLTGEPNQSNHCVARSSIRQGKPPSLKIDRSWSDKLIQDRLKVIYEARGLPVPPVKVTEQPNKQLGKSCGWVGCATAVVADTLGWQQAMKVFFVFCINILLFFQLLWTKDSTEYVRRWFNHAYHDIIAKRHPKPLILI